MLQTHYVLATAYGDSAYHGRIFAYLQYIEKYTDKFVVGLDYMIKLQYQSIYCKEYYLYLYIASASSMASSVVL
jgi:hypothetical protein